MTGIAVIAVVILGYFALLVALGSHPPEMSGIGRRWFIRGVRCAGISALLLAFDLAVRVNMESDDSNVWRHRIYWSALWGFCVNAAAVFSFFRVFAGFLPFTKGDAADVTPAGIALGLIAVLLQFVFVFFLLFCA